MTSFVALYRGQTIAEARIVAVSANPDLVTWVASEILDTPTEPAPADPILNALAQGRDNALRLIKEEAA